jgi:small subunit ribosomal protein S17
MADDETKNEETEVSDTTAADEAAQVSDTTAADAGDTPVSDTTTADAGDTATEEVSDTSPPTPVAETAAAEEVSDTTEKKPRSRKHVPRSQRRARTKPVREKPAARKPITRTEKPASELGRRQERRGVVISDKGDKTIVVKVDVIKSHPRYKKVVRRAVKFHAHDEGNTAGIGDTVRIVETRPLSKTKRWRLAEIVEKAR